MKKNKKIISALLSIFCSITSVHGRETKPNNIKKQTLLNADMKEKTSTDVNKKPDNQQLDKKKVIFPAILTLSAFILTLAVVTNKKSGQPNTDNRKVPDPIIQPNTNDHQNFPLINTNSIENIKFSDFENLNFDDSMVEKVKISDPVLRYYERYNENIQVKYSNPEKIMGPNFSEDDMRSNPKKYFSQDQNGYTYVKDMSGQLHCTGKIIIPSLKELLDKANKIENKKGTLNFVYGNEKLLDVHNVLDSGVFQLANPASNFNGIETTGSGDFNKKLSAYVEDRTQGPWFMKKCPWTSLFLLHVLNGKKTDKNSPVNNDFAKNLFQVMNNEQFELNILGDYEIKTSAGYIASEIPNNFESKDMDGMYRSLVVEHAPVSLRGGSAVGTPYTYLGDQNTIDIFLDAAIPGSYGKSYDKKHIIPHLWRHYMSMISYCKVKGIKNALISLTGNGVFHVPLEYHLEVLSSKKIQDAIENSGTNFIVNGYTGVKYLINNKCTALPHPWDEVLHMFTNHKYKCTNVYGLKSWEEVFGRLGLK